MSDAVITGIGSTTFTRHEGRGVLDLAGEAGLAAIEDAAIDPGEIQALFLGNFLGGILGGQEMMAPMVAADLGLTDVEAVKFEGACASSALALREAVRLVRSGDLETVLVVGAEKMTGAPTERFTSALGLALDQSSEGQTGLTFPGYWGLVMSRYMHEYGATREQIAAVSVKNRSNGVNNEYAQFRSAVTLEEVVGSRAVCSPIQLYDCCPATDGAAAVVVSRSRPNQGHAVLVAGSSAVAGPPRAVDQDDLTVMPAVVAAGDRAFEEAGLDRSAVNVAELHDCFTMAEIAETESLRFYDPGEGAAAAAKGATGLDGELPVNPSGGLLSKGHPVGATGCGQVFELVRQLRGEHPNQIEGATVGLAHNAGGTGGVATVHILKG